VLAGVAKLVNLVFAELDIVFTGIHSFASCGTRLEGVAAFQEVGLVTDAHLGGELVVGG
jgi:hypothetical protein